jgi:ribulose-5-phosphate 4-epimerase/fuculose-1-phosphate aldolase
VHLSGDKPAEEAFLHQCMYCERKGAGAVVHLHSTYAVAVSIIDGLDPEDLLPPLTAYYVMWVGRLPLFPIIRRATKSWDIRWR